MNLLILVLSAIVVNGALIPDTNVRMHLEAMCKAAGHEITFTAGGTQVEAPVETALDNLAGTYVRKNIYGPNPPELNRSVGSLTAACVWFETLTGESCVGNSYIPAVMKSEPERVEVAQLCAHAACVQPDSPTDVGRRDIFHEVLVEPGDDCVLQDPLRMENGRRVRSVAQWKRKRRPELFAMFEREMFGRAPGRPDQLHFETVYRDAEALGGKAVRKEVKVHFDNTGRHYLRLLIYTPAGIQGPVPAFLGINFKGNWTVSMEEGISMPTPEEMKAYGGSVETLERGANASRWPVEEIIAAGYGVATFYRGDVDPDFDDCFQNGVHPLFYKPGQDYPEPDEWGTIAAWAWGLSRALDYLETDADVDAARVAVIGHSRLGKTALWAGAADTRFAMVISNDSGNCGAALTSRKFGETVGRVNYWNPHWFCDNFMKYNFNVEALPFDQHELIALIAPRPVCVGSATEDHYADPKGEFLGIKGASPVYELFGLEGLSGAEFPEPDSYVGEGPLRYHLRTGRHSITIADWRQYIKFADRYL